MSLRTTLLSSRSMLLLSLIFAVAFPSSVKGNQLEGDMCINAVKLNEKGNELNNNSQAEISLYKKAIELCPKYASPYYNLGVIYEELDKFEESIYYYNKYLIVNPEADDKVIVTQTVRKLENKVKATENTQNSTEKEQYVKYNLFVITWWSRNNRCSKEFDYVNERSQIYPSQSRVKEVQIVAACLLKNSLTFKDSVPPRLYLQYYSYQDKANRMLIMACDSLMKYNRNRYAADLIEARQYVNEYNYYGGLATDELSKANASTKREK